MMEMRTNYFYGNKVSDYGIENGYVDYRTLAKSFDAVMNNDIIEKTAEIGYWEQISGFADNSTEIEELQDKIAELEEQEGTEDEIEELEEKIEELEREADEYTEIYQYYIVSDSGASILQECGEIVFYNEELDMYVWGVTHWGTSWDYVLTNIKIVNDEQ